MKLMKWAGLTGLLGGVLLAAPVQAEQKYGFANISANYLGWNHTPQKHRDDFAYLELEGGSGYNWGELYGFTDLENLDKSSDKYSIFAKGQLRYYLGKHTDRSGFNLFLQGKVAANKAWHEFSTVTGLGYNLKIGNGWFTPFFGPLYSNTTSGFAGWNGYQLGWAIVYPFSIGKANFMVTNWHEFEFGRKDAYLPKGAPSTSQNGALAFWWKATKDWTFGVKYRYAYNTLGAAGYTDAYIGTVMFNF